MRDKTHRREVRRLTKTIGTLQQSAELMEVRLQSLTSSSAADARSIEHLKAQISHLNACNQKWDREGARLLKETKRLRAERDLARLRPSPASPTSP